MAAPTPHPMVTALAALANEAMLAPGFDFVITSNITGQVLVPPSDVWLSIKPLDGLRDLFATPLAVVEGKHSTTYCRRMHLLMLLARLWVATTAEWKSMTDDRPTETPTSAFCWRAALASVLINDSSRQSNLTLALASLRDDRPRFLLDFSSFGNTIREQSSLIEGFLFSALDVSCDEWLSEPPGVFKSLLRSHSITRTFELALAFDDITVTAPFVQDLFDVMWRFRCRQRVRFDRGIRQQIQFQWTALFFRDQCTLTDDALAQLASCLHGDDTFMLQVLTLPSLDGVSADTVRKHLPRVVSTRGTGYRLERLAFTAHTDETLASLTTAIRGGCAVSEIEVTVLPPAMNQLPVWLAQSFFATSSLSNVSKLTIRYRME